QVRRPACIASIPLRINGDELHTSGDDSVGIAPFLDGMTNDERHPGGEAHIIGIDHHGTLLERATMLFQDDVSERLHQGMTRVDKAGHRRADTVEEPHILFLETNSLILAQHRLTRAAVAATELPVPFADERRDMGNLPAPRFSCPQLPTQMLKGLRE